MKFLVEKKGRGFIVFNDTTGYVRGTHKTEGDAKVQAKQLQELHDETVRSASASVGKKSPDLSGEE